MRSLALSLLLVPAALAAQDSDRVLPGGYTRMILGGGVQRYAPTLTVGVEHKKATSKLGVRLMAEFRENSSGMPSQNGLFSQSSTYGLQLLGTRAFREGRRFEPYVQAGVGVYQTRGTFQRVDFNDPNDPLSFTPGEFVNHRSTTPGLVWGVGLNARVLGVTLFGDFKLPTWSYRFGTLQYGQAAPLTFGIRF